MNKTTPESLYAIYYYLCKQYAKADGISLYQYYAMHFDGIMLRGALDIVNYLSEKNKINEDLRDYIKEQYPKTLEEKKRLKHSYSRLEILKDLLEISEDDISLIMTFYLRDNLPTLEYCHLKKVYDSVVKDNSVMLKVASIYNRIFSSKMFKDGDILIEEIGETTKKKWDELFIGTKPKDAKEAIVENLIILETINTDEISKEAIDNLKELLNKQFNIKFD